MSLNVNTLQIPPIPLAQIPVPAPEQTIEQVGSVVKITEKIEDGGKVTGLDDLVRDSSILSYSREDDRLIVYAKSAEIAEKLKSLQIETQSLGETGIMQKLKELLVPPDIEENCAEEYVRFRLCQLGAAVCGGALVFANNILAEGAKGLIPDKEKIVKALELNGIFSKVTSLAGSYVARHGDVDPKRFSTMSTLVSTATTIGSVAALAAAPGAFFGVALGTAVIWALSGTLGGAAGVNIANHMAKGPNKGEVAAKNGNQDLLAGLMGAPVALGLARIAGVMGVSPFALTALTMGTACLLLQLTASSMIKMEPMTQGSIEKILDNFIKTGQVPEADQKSWLENIKSVFVTKSEEVSKRMTFADSQDEIVGKDKDAIGAERLFTMYNDENYLLSYHGTDDKINIAFKEKGTTFEDVMKAMTQSRLMEMAFNGGMLPVLQNLCGDRAGIALVDLTHRALPDKVNIEDMLKEKGWHPSTGSLEYKKLDIPIGPDKESEKPLTMEQFLKLVASPEPAELKKILRPEDMSAAPGLPRAA